MLWCFRAVRIMWVMARPVWFGSWNSARKYSFPREEKPYTTQMIACIPKMKLYFSGLTVISSYEPEIIVQSLVYMLVYGCDSKFRLLRKNWKSCTKLWVMWGFLASTYVFVDWFSGFDRFWVGPLPYCTYGAKNIRTLNSTLEYHIYMTLALTWNPNMWSNLSVPGTTRPNIKYGPGNPKHAPHWPR